MVTFKNANQDDIEVIRRIAFAVWPVAYEKILSKEQMDYMLDKMYSAKSLLENMKENEFILALDEREVIGFASFSSHAENEDVYHLNKIYILPSQQNKNCGRLMIDHVIETIKSRGATSLQLNVNRQNPAKHFYKKLDFSVIKKEDIDIGSGFFMNDFVMEKNL